MKTLSIGRLVYDVNILLDGYPTEGSENTTKEMITCSGGSANIIAYSLGRWNAESFISGVIGYDETGTTMKKIMEENKVKTNYLETNYDIKTPTSYIFMNKQNNSRTVVSTAINEFNIKKYEYDTSMDCVIADGYEYNASVYAFNKYSNAITILNAKTPHNGLLDFFKYAKYVVCSSAVAEAIAGEKIDFNAPMTMANVYKRIVDKYPHVTLFITMEGKGTIYAVNNEIKVLATINTDIVDKTGARDIFAAMVGYGITSGYDIETTIRLATIAESMSKKTIGSTLSIPLLSDVIKYYEDKFGPLALKNENVEGVSPNGNTTPTPTQNVASPNQNIALQTPTPAPSVQPELSNAQVTPAPQAVTPQPVGVAPETPKVSDEQVLNNVFNSAPSDMNTMNSGNNNAPSA